MKTGYLQPLHTSSKKTITVDDSKGRASDINSNPFGAGTFSSDTSNHNDHKDNNNNDNDSIGGGGAYSRKQVVVVVTEGWHVLCFDHRLQFLWESSVDADFIDSYIGEVAINIDSHRVRDADMGMVLVGGRLQSRFDANHLVRTCAYTILENIHACTCTPVLEQIIGILARTLF